MRRATIANISAIQNLEGVKKVLLDLVQALNTSRVTENTLTSNVTTINGLLVDSIFLSAESDSNLDPATSGGFQFSFGN